MATSSTRHGRVSPILGDISDRSLDMGGTGVKTDPDTLSGPELDAAVAEEVMGWKTYKRGMMGDYVRFFPPEGDPSTDPDGFVPINVGPGWDWSPSTDFSDAWEVVVEMRYNGWAFDFDNMCGVDCVTAGFVDATDSPTRPDETILAIHSCGEDGPDAAPVSICRAALKAVRAVQETT